MPHLFTVPAGNSIAELSARHFVQSVPREEWPRAVMLVPTRRSAQVMRAALLETLGGEAALLPRILPLAEIGNELMNLMGEAALAQLEALPPAMDAAQQRYLLASYVEAFERGRMGASVLEHSLALTDSLMELQERCARHGVTLTQERIRPLLAADFAEHWKQSLEFLAILTDHWPAIEAECGLTTAPAREVRLMEALSQHWRASPPDYAVYAIGSSASQPATAELLHTIAELPRGAVILPGLDSMMDSGEWARIAPGHPLFHLKQFLDRWPLAPNEVSVLNAEDMPDAAQPAEPSPSLGGRLDGGRLLQTPAVKQDSTDPHPTLSLRRERAFAASRPQACDDTAGASLWLEALAPAEIIPHWRARALPHYSHLGLIPCAHGEEEVRVISLLLREGLESPHAHIALITPDEGLMARVAAQMQRYGIRIDRMSSGTLATTATGSLWQALIEALVEPERPLLLRSLLHHPLLAIAPEILTELEPGWHGIQRTPRGQLPRHGEQLAKHPNYLAVKQFVARLAFAGQGERSAGDWLTECRELLALLVPESGEAHEAVEEALAALTHAERFGRIAVEDFAALVRELLAAKRRDVGLATHPRIHLLTPVEARLQRFDRVILANMQEAMWPGAAPINPWLNRAAETALGLPVPEEHISLMAHDVLMLASAGEVFLTYPKRDGGAPVPRSRFIERLVTLLAAHGVAEETITRREYVYWANERHASDGFAPEPPAMPRPTSAERPRRLPVTDIEKLFTDPFAIYAKHVLGLKPLKDIDATPEASDFGSLTHRAAEQLAAHWNTHGRSANEAELEAIAQAALRALSDRPNIDLFWRKRLMLGLRFLNRMEATRRTEGATVECEQTVEGAMTLANGEAMTLFGRIDRLERHGERLTIIDHKTGEAPSENEILSGKAPQLLAYALLMQGEGAPAVEYWALPKRGEEGEITHVEPGAEGLLALEESLNAAFTQFLAGETPLLATPYEEKGNPNRHSDYDGISRYDEWAG